MSRISSDRIAFADERAPRSPHVHIIDPDPSSVEFVHHLAYSRKIPVDTYACGEDFWKVLDAHTSGCVVVEVDLPGFSGIQLLERMKAADIRLPVVMLAEEGDVAVAVRAMKLGAVDFLQKPCHPLELWEAMQTALERDRESVQQSASVSQAVSQLGTLTEGESLVLQMALEGKQKKAIARRLNLSLRTIDFRRASILRKMESKSFIDLAQKLATIEELPQLFAARHNHLASLNEV